jgi:cohesin complex subunit SA-1/2
MVVQALHLLALHIIWKGKALVTDLEPSPEESRFRETLKKQRESLLEKLVEYAVGTQSNTVEGVKRAVSSTCLCNSCTSIIFYFPQAFRSLLDLHVLFSSAQTIAADGSPLSTASVALTLDDEVQYRCAGFIQAEIERYAEALDDGIGDEDDGEGADEDDSSDDEQVNNHIKRRKRKDGTSKKTELAGK